jgi:hypothetical protein
MATPSVEDLLQQLIQGQQRTMERIDAIVVQSTNTNTRIDEVLKRVEDIELAQSLSVYHPTSAPEDVPNPLLLNTKRSTERSKSSSPTNSDADDKESSIANPGNKEDLAAVRGRSRERAMTYEEFLDRVRQGVYRILYGIHDEQIRVEVIRGGHRGEVYRTR